MEPGGLALAGASWRGLAGPGPGQGAGRARVTKTSGRINAGASAPCWEEHASMGAAHKACPPAPPRLLPRFPYRPETFRRWAMAMRTAYFARD